MASELVFTPHMISVGCNKVIILMNDEKVSQISLTSEGNVENIKYISRYIFLLYLSQYNKSICLLKINSAIIAN